MFMKKNIFVALGVWVATVVASVQAQEAWSLRKCIDFAIEHNIQVQKSANEVERSKADVSSTKWARLPNLNGSVGQNWSWGRSASPVDNTYNDINSANTRFGVNTSVPLFTGLNLPNQYALSKLNLKAAVEDLNKAKNDLAIQVASSYLQVLFNEELSRVALEQVKISREQSERIGQLHRMGKASPAEVAEAQARLSQDELSAVQADNNYQLALLDLSQLLELPSPEGFVLLPPVDEVVFVPLTHPDDIYMQALTGKPEIKAAEYRLQGSLKSVRIALSDYYPQLSFSAGLGTNYYSVNGSADSFSGQMKNNLSEYVGFSLSVPLFDRLSTHNRVKTARLQRTNMALQLEETKKTLYKEIQQAYYNAVAAESRYRSGESAVSANRESFRLTSEKFNAGKATSVEYNEAKLNYTKALSDQIQAKYEYLFRVKILDFYKGDPIQ